jgi:hypothetical protein
LKVTVANGLHKRNIHSEGGLSPDIEVLYTRKDARETESTDDKAVEFSFLNKG